LTSAPFEGLFVDGNGPQTILLEGNKVTIPDLNGFPKKDLELTGAMMEERRRFGLGMLWLGILLFFVIGVGVIFIILYYYVKVKVVVLSPAKGEEIVIRGPRDSLEDLHYMVQRCCLKDRKKEKGVKKRRGVGKKKEGGATALTCPQCGSHDIYYEAGLYTGRKYHCKKCDYIGAFIIEQSLEP